MKTTTEKYFAHRATIRHYKPEKPSDEFITALLEEAMRAPTTGTMQLYSVISTSAPQNLRKLTELHFCQPAASNAPLMLTFCADFARFTRWCEVSNAKPGYDNFLSFLSAALDATILAQQFVTIAELNGLGTCYLGSCIYNARQISELLELPKLVVPICCLSVGFPDQEIQPTERLNVNDVLYSEKYPTFSDEDIKRIYKVKDEFPVNAKYVAENNMESLAQVFTDIRYPRQLNEDVSKTLIDFLAEQGFLKMMNQDVSDNPDAKGLIS